MRKSTQSLIRWIIGAILAADLVLARSGRSVAELAAFVDNFLDYAGHRGTVYMHVKNAQEYADPGAGPAIQQG